MKYLRIKKNTQFQKLFTRGKKVFSPNITLLYFPSDKLSMGVAVSKKHGCAVKRNRIKRLLRASFRECCTSFKRPYSVILIPRTDGEYSYKAFVKSLNICIKKVNECA
ncbi:MAG: ribonuclease P protein component [Clostridia bacterium]|nr:ribonuclease P protein component [Clostridia bacterium]